MGQTRLRVAVVGVSHWHAPRYLAGLRALGEEIVGVSDPDPAVAGRVAAELGVRGDTDGLALVDRARPDVVVAMATHAAMPAQTAALLLLGPGLILEKPLGRRAAEVEPLARIARRSGRFAAVAFINRHARLWDEFGRLQAAGRLGPVVHAHFRVVNGPPSRYTRDGVGWMLDPAIAGGGALRNLGIHSADALCRLAGDEPLAVRGAAVSRRAHAAPVEEFAAAVVGTASGFVGTLEAGYTFASMAAGGDAEARVMAANATLIARDGRLLVRTLDDGGEQRYDEAPAGRLYDVFLADSLARFRRGAPPLATIDDCWRAMQLLDAIYAAADEPATGQAGNRAPRAGVPERGNKIDG
jgi:predicted dehydrogenase